jgi:hypothetical protein
VEFDAFALCGATSSVPLGGVPLLSVQGHCQLITWNGLASLGACRTLSGVDPTIRFGLSLRWPMIMYGYPAMLLSRFCCSR